MLKIKALIILFFTLSVMYSQQEENAVEEKQIVIIKMKNGDQFRGEIIDQNSNTIVLKTDNGEFKLSAANVDSIEKSEYRGEFTFENPHDSRYFFGPSAIPVKKRKGYYQNLMITTNFVNYGISKNLSIGGGFEFISTVTGNPIWFFTPKVGFDINKNFHVGGGVIMAGFAARGAATLGYGVVTVGHAESNITLGAGYGFVSGEFAEYPPFMVSGTHRITNSIALLSENYFIPNSENALNYFGIQGIRVLSEKNSFDIGGIVIPAIADVVPALPYVGYVRVF